MNLPIEEQRQARIVGQLISAAGGVEAAGRDCGKSKSLPSAYQSPHDARSMPLRDIEQLESITHGTAGHPLVTRYLARQAGCILIKRPVTHTGKADVLPLLARQAMERGEADREMFTALEDSTIDPAEAARLVPLMRKKLETDAQILAELEAIAGMEVS